MFMALLQPWKIRNAVFKLSFVHFIIINRDIIKIKPFSYQKHIFYLRNNGLMIAI